MFLKFLIDYNFNTSPPMIFFQTIDPFSNIHTKSLYDEANEQ